MTGPTSVEFADGIIVEFEGNSGVVDGLLEVMTDEFEAMIGVELEVPLDDMLAGIEGVEIALPDLSPPGNDGEELELEAFVIDAELEGLLLLEDLEDFFEADMAVPDRLASDGGTPVSVEDDELDDEVGLVTELENEARELLFTGPTRVDEALPVVITVVRIEEVDVLSEVVVLVMIPGPPLQAAPPSSPPSSPPSAPPEEMMIMVADCTTMTVEDSMLMKVCEADQVVDQ